MGIEIWVLVVLAAVLSLYMLPTLVGRREMMGSSRSEDRYSAQLRILATGTPESDEVCSAGGGHAQIFESRPEVRVLDRPAVRSVRSLRMERELEQARATHLANRVRRRRAAERRALVVLALLGASLVMLLVVAFTKLPWWDGLFAPAVTVVAFAYGRWATQLDKAGNQRELRKIAAMRRQLRSVSGAEGARRLAADSERARRAAAPSRSAHSARSAGSARSSASALSARSAVSTPSAASPATPAAMREAAELVTSAAAVQQEAAPVTQLPTASRVAEVAEFVPAKPVAREVSVAKRRVAPPEVELAPTTPPQGWSPVNVPAPTYTLAGRAPRRKVVDAGVEAVADLSVRTPLRPKAVRSFSLDGIEAEEHTFHPIDLDAVLARRRAVGE
ncbi:Uncharacterised protein [Actinomyces bovis]|uniref:Uncharacterized protein n=1 Tax=Actinomyces bovis TaxID=1658 RepID=A0ABY1VQ37_9ACTO|nr:hypothetical protein [Actinomyces bovis]SPT54224.1 Uncharacterised protein [Actinomyces bovis]VEG56506.1 Uncharacterised protein [Actinomyces israelii]